MTKVLFTVALASAALATPARAERAGHWCGAPHRASQFAAEAGKRSSSARAIRTIFVNKNGGTYTVVGGPSASSTNSVTSVEGLSQVFGPVGSTFTIPPISNKFNWPLIIQCVKDAYKKFNVRVTESEPTSGDYVEAVVGGDGSEFKGDAQAGLLGIAAADNFCGVTERGVAFSLSESHIGIPDSNHELCATIVHEAGHLLALYHESEPTDEMSYVGYQDAGSIKAFQDKQSTCGTYPDQPQACNCTNGTINSGTTKGSHFVLSGAVGLRPIETNPPTLDIKSPGGNELPPTFDVVATATDADSGIDSVTAYIDGIEFGAATMASGNDYTLKVRNAPEGPHTLKVNASDQAGNITVVEKQVTIVKLQTGATCIDNGECTGGLCAQDPEGNYCTQSCQVASDTCPSDFECQDIGGGQTICVSTGGGCCSASPNIGAAGCMSLLVGAVLFRRRRRPA